MEDTMRLLPTLLFVLAVCIAAPSAISTEKKEEEKPPYYLTDAELDKKLGVAEKDETQRVEAPKEYVWVVYFHRVPGCDTCQLMSKYIYETIEKRFGDNVKGKEIVLRYQNFEDRKNAALVTRLGIRSPMLAIIQIKDGRLVKAKLADKVWALAADKDKFIDYVEKEIKIYTEELKRNGRL
jgi:DNA-binding protein